MIPSRRSFGSRRLLSDTETLWRTYELFTPGRGPEQRRELDFLPTTGRTLTSLPSGRSQWWILALRCGV